MKLRADNIFKLFKKGAKSAKGKVRSYCAGNEYNDIAMTAAQMERWCGEAHRGLVVYDCVTIRWSGKITHDDDYFNYIGYAWVGPRDIIINTNYLIKFSIPTNSNTTYIWTAVHIRMSKLADLVLKRNDYTVIIKLKHVSGWNTTPGELIVANNIEVSDKHVIYKK